MKILLGMLLKKRIGVQNQINYLIIMFVKNIDLIIDKSSLSYFYFYINVSY